MMLKEYRICMPLTVEEVRINVAFPSDYSSPSLKVNKAKRFFFVASVV